MSTTLTSGRPAVMGRRGVIASGHYLASAAGFRVMEQGGNAFDAAVASGFCLNLLEPHQNGLGGEAPTVVYPAKEKKAFAVSGMGWSPKALTIGWCKEHGIDMIPGNGYLPACVPAMVDTWATLLARWGTMSLAQVLAPAIELAEEGFPLYPELRTFFVDNRARLIDLYPTTAEVFLRDGQVPEVGEIIRNPSLANTLRLMCRAEEEAKHKGRVAGIEAARDVFYKGEIAERIIEFTASNPVEDASGKAHTGLLSYEDFAEWHAQVEEPASIDYRGLTVHKCSSWTQGPVLLQQLATLEGFDLKAMGPCSAEYIHTWIECAKLAFADREAYYGDPLFDDVPFDVLLSKRYADGRRGLIGSEASMDLRPGDVGRGIPDYVTFDVREDNKDALARYSGDTTHVEVVDREGNMVSATPSGGWIHTSPVIPGLGFPLGTRGQMFYLNPDRPNALEPRKRPRATLTPSLVTKNGEPYMTFGTPGGDGQDQWTCQFFINYVDFGMDLQQALDGLHFGTSHFPSSFYPRAACPGVITLDNRTPPEVVEELKKRGHKVGLGPYEGLKMTAIRFDGDRGVITGGVCSNPTTAYAMGW